MVQESLPADVKGSIFMKQKAYLLVPKVQTIWWRKSFLPADVLENKASESEAE